MLKNKFCEIFRTGKHTDANGKEFIVTVSAKGYNIPENIVITIAEEIVDGLNKLNDSISNKCRIWTTLPKNK